jgi:hypothetical protein
MRREIKRAQSLISLGSDAGGVENQAARAAELRAEMARLKELAEEKDWQEMSRLKRLAGEQEGKVR